MAIYGMFLAIIIPPAKKNRAVLAVVAAAMAISLWFKVIPLLKNVPPDCDHYYHSDRGRCSCLFLPVQEEKQSMEAGEEEIMEKEINQCIIFTSIYW